MAPQQGPGSSPSTLYVTGSFPVIGGLTANGIAAWDGRMWRTLAEGTGGTAGAMAVFDDGLGDGPVLFVVGTASWPDRVARWDGTSWSVLPQMSIGVPSDVAVFDDGQGGGPMLHIAGSTATVRWDGQAALPLGPDDPDRPRGQAVRLKVLDLDGAGPQPPMLYAAVSAPFPELAAVTRWDGERWSRLGTWPHFSRVVALEVFTPGGEGPQTPQLYAGGSFSFPGDQPARNLARWDGEEWRAVTPLSRWPVASLRIFDDGRGGGPALYVGSEFRQTPLEQLGGIARYDGVSFSPLEGGVTGISFISGKVSDLVPYDDGDGPSLVVLGDFTHAGSFGIPSRGAAVWDGAAWHGLGAAAPIPTPLNFASGGPPDRRLVAVAADGSAPTGMAVWNGDSWRLEQTPAEYSTFKWLDLDDGQGLVLYASGSRRDSNGILRPEVARHTPSGWEVVGSGADVAGFPWVTALGTFRPNPDGPTLLVVGGRLGRTLGTPSAVMSWDGAAWLSVGSPLARINQPNGSYRDIAALVAFDDGSGPALYAGGAFTHVGDTVLNGIARLEGSEWAPVGGEFLLSSGAPGMVSALLPSTQGPLAPGLYAGGKFNSAGSGEVSNIARWDGNSWEPLAEGLPGLVNALVFYDTDGRGPAQASLFAGGFFLEGGDPPTASLARWDGESWSRSSVALTIRAPYPPYIHALGTVQTDDGGEVLVVAGEFSAAGPVPLESLALYGGCDRCPADYSGDGVVNSGDISAFLQGWLAAVTGGPVDADFNRDGAVNSGDISAFLSEWLAAVTGGC